jgi:hypothetical protein
MATIICFPNYESERFEPLRNFIDEAERRQLDELDQGDRNALQSAIDYAWEGVVAIEQGWRTKLLFAYAGFAIGFWICP